MPRDAVRIRPIAPEDAEAIAPLYDQSAAHLRSLGCEGPFRFDARAFRRDGFGAVRAFEGIVALLGDAEEARPVAYLLYTFGYDTDRASRHLFVLDLLVDEAHRGLGIGAALMDAAREIAHSRGVEELAWRVHERNTRAIRFYERLGAELQTEVREMHWEPTPGR